MLFSILALLPMTISAQTIVQTPIVCDESKKLLDFLEAKYQEELIWIGRHEQGNNMLTVLMVNKTTQTWSLLWLRGAVACLVDAGSNWQSVSRQSI